jgi:4-hydroxy-3-polyprenylbenzoate decarboxylase
MKLVCAACGFRWEIGKKESIKNCPECGASISLHQTKHPPLDLREFIEVCEAAGELKRIKVEVNWNLELSHIAKLNEERKGPVLLFENVKGYDTPVLTSAFTKPSKVALALGMDPSYGIVDIAREWTERVTKALIKPKKVSDGPVMANKMEGNGVKLTSFPVPFWTPLDGGRYFGTTSFLVSRDPETGFVNCGVYRMQLHDDKSLGLQLLKGKDAEVMLNKYREIGEQMPVAAVIGGPPLAFLVGSTLIPYGTDEYDVMGALMGRPIEIFESDLTGLPIPANAEIVVEGFVDPNPENFRPEGPFGEYTGYYSGKALEEFPKPWIKVERVLYRDNPIFWGTTVGRPVTDTHMVQSINRTAELWTQLLQAGVPGIQSVYIPPQSTGRFWAIVSVKQTYPGHGRHAGLAAFTTVVGNYGLKGVIVVDDDIRADDLDRVWWAMSVRYNPIEDTEIIKKGRSTPLDPSLPAYTDYYDHRLLVSRILIDATTPFEWERKPVLIELDKDVVERIKKRWNEFGFDWRLE